MKWTNGASDGRGPLPTGWAGIAAVLVAVGFASAGAAAEPATRTGHGTATATGATPAVAGGTTATTPSSGPVATSAVTAAGEVGANRNPIEVPAGPWAETDRMAASGAVTRIEAAIARYEASPEVTSSAVQWRLSKAYFHLYDELPRDAEHARERAAKLAVVAGEAAVSTNDPSDHAKYWYAQAMLAASDMQGAMTFLSKIKDIKELVKEVRVSSPEIDDAGPDRFFAIFYASLPWPFKDRDRAYAAAERAYELAPYRCANVYVYAKALIGEEEFAKAEPLVEELEDNRCTASSPMWDGIYQDYGAELRKDLPK